MAKTLYPACAVLIVDDEPMALHSTKRLLRSTGISHVLCCEDSRKVLPLLDETHIGVILLDLFMPHLSGDELLPKLVEAHPDVPVIVVTGANEIETAVRCMRAGAADYMVKPVERNRMLSSVQRAIEVHELRRENSLLREGMLSDTLKHPEAFTEIITKNSSMHSIFRYVETIAATQAVVLITGETGAGKELIARALHTLSGRTGGFVAANAAGLDDNMFSDTLFGHVRGAYTGADTPRKGLIEQAAGGTLFLDEIGDLSEASQVKLLRLLQEREYLPLGADIPKRSDARVITATNRDLDKLQETGSFRKDLYYRLKTHHIHVPPLRKRLDDLPLLVDHFVAKASRILGKKKPAYPEQVHTLLATHTFPGNIRELESMIFDAVSKHETRMLSMDPFKMQVERAQPAARPKPQPSEPEEQNPFAHLDALPTLKDSAQLLVAEAMRRAQGNQAIAARLVGISRTALNKRLKQNTP